MDDGWHTLGDSLVPPCLPSTPQSSWQPYLAANASKGSWVLQKIWKKKSQTNWQQACQWSLSRWTCQHRRNQLYLRLSTRTTRYSGIDEDVSSRRDGFSAWAISDPATTLERHVASKGSAKPIYRDADDRRHFPPSQNIVSTTTCPTVYSSKRV